MVNRNSHSNPNGNPKKKERSPKTISAGKPRDTALPRQVIPTWGGFGSGGETAYGTRSHGAVLENGNGRNQNRPPPRRRVGQHDYLGPALIIVGAVILGLAIYYGL